MTIPSAHFGPPSARGQASDLPVPSVAEQTHSAALVARIRAEIEAHGAPIPFHQFMHLALYTPGLGYYVAGQRRFGAEGDFITAPLLGDLFARALARPAAALLQPCGGDILEAGAGSGDLAADLLLALESLQQLPSQYLILEVSPDLRHAQRETIQGKAPHLLERVRWLDDLPQQINGLVLANEVLDAMPVHLFEIDAEGQAWERTVGWQQDAFVWDRATPSAVLTQRLDRRALSGPYQSEINLAAEHWIRAIDQRLQCGAVLLIDYGFPASEYYHPQRHMGTLMCHYRHHAHDDPLTHIGLQDITAHIDFSAMAAASDLELLGYTSQALFLLDAGMDVLLQESMHSDPAKQWAIANQVKKLTLPSEMGELFKVLALGRGIDQVLPGFAGRQRPL